VGVKDAVLVGDAESAESAEEVVGNGGFGYRVEPMPAPMPMAVTITATRSTMRREHVLGGAIGAVFFRAVTEELIFSAKALERGVLQAVTHELTWRAGGGSSMAAVGEARAVNRPKIQRRNIRVARLSRRQHARSWDTKYELDLLKRRTLIEQINLEVNYAAPLFSFRSVHPHTLHRLKKNLSQTPLALCFCESPRYRKPI
jgi:Iap family predicted aminopeptidase